MIGTVILFGFLILALSLYQVQVVPQENAQVEFQHFEEVQNDLVEVRNAVSSAGQSERPQFVDVRLGTNYQTRLFAINPPAPAGTLQTSRPYNITITDESGETENVSTRFVRYRPGYNELQVGSIWYDNSALYLDERESGSRAVIIEDQNLVTDNDTLRITALQNEFQASGTRRVALELYPADDAATLSQLDGELTVSIPTRLGADDGYWNESIENGSVTYLGVDDDGYPSSDDVSALRLRVDSPDNITVNSVGVQSEPSEGAVRDNIGPSSGRETDDSNDHDGSTSVWTDCPVPPSPPAEGEDGVRYVSSSPASNINAGGDTVVIEDGVSVSTNINNPGDVFIGTGASVSTNIGASGVIVLGENAQISGNVNSGTDFYLLPGSSTSSNVGVSGTIYLDNRGQIGGNVNSGTVQECTVA
ncbi:hypothetical protein C461_10918 [Halorubrum aidingense JCM 13560]|uniref:Uncharacterized protein n=1 Tax=Halorubrum aidingense JCM 13560 TaxID=1230454 RepID=M0P8U0_9EURY|nr:polymer-forming cytoskeletal protein [Halorubrum aidingense]EMA66547.1 hypothetical protein C461_10918 [Halorubrum aidingense JCM 13560]